MSAPVHESPLNSATPLPKARSQVVGLGKNTSDLDENPIYEKPCI